MKIKVSKVFAKFINDTAKELGFKVKAKVMTMDFRQYLYFVGEEAMFDAEQTGDRDWLTGDYKVIQLIYPEDYYACPHYLTTAALTKEMRRMGVTDADGLKRMIRELCEV